MATKKQAEQTGEPEVDAAPAAKAVKDTILPPLRIKLVKLAVIGDTPLIVHAWSQKAKLEMLNKQTQEATGARDAKDPQKDFEQSMYQLADGGYGFPSVAFKTAAVTACTSIASMTKVAARQAFHIVGEQIAVESAFRLNGVPLVARYDLVRILSGLPEMREDMVTIGQGKRDLRYRGQFWPWAAELSIRYNQGVLSEAQIFNLINTAGFAVGVGEWRPEKDGTNGMFHLAEAGEIEILDDLRRQADAVASASVAKLRAVA